MTSTRNTLCRCGSGKKTKHCCGSEITTPVATAEDFYPGGDVSGAQGPDPCMVAFKVHDKRAVKQAFADAAQQLVPVDADGAGNEPSWEWMANVGDPTSSAEVTLVGRCLMVVAQSETTADGCRLFIAGIVGAAATVEETFHIGQQPEGSGWQSHSLTASDTRYPHLVADLREYLDMGDLSIRVTGKARSIAMYLGRIASSASTMAVGDPYYTEVACRRKPKSRSCKSEVVASCHADGHIEWHCIGCGDSGTINGWEETAFDARGRTELLDDPGNPDTHSRILILRPQDVRRLQALVHLTAPALRFLMSEQKTTTGKLQFVGTRHEVAALARCIAFHFVGASNLAVSSEDALYDLHGDLAYHGEVIPDLSPAAQAAEVLLFERSRYHGPRPSLPDAAASYRLHVRLQDIAPPIWRQLELPGDFTLADLSDALILSFGWADTHLHLFKQDGRTFGRPDPDSDEPITNERSALLGDVLATVGANMVWEYDFGDSWRHEIVVEEIMTEGQVGPRLISGARATPPEDCGGPPGYENLLEALRDPTHEEHGFLREWSADFDPEEFELEQFGERVSRMTEHEVSGPTEPATHSDSPN
ncbi:MAG: hypothetical protein ACI8QZ_003198 [Chlamydiales bacterium]|jgi:hypothetical protein